MELREFILILNEERWRLDNKVGYERCAPGRAWTVHVDFPKLIHPGSLFLRLRDVLISVGQTPT